MNFYSNVREVTDLRTIPRMSLAYGYYGYRYGLYENPRVAIDAVVAELFKRFSGVAASGTPLTMQRAS